MGYENGTTELGDEHLLERATQLGCVLFTQDVDLLVITEQWLRTSRVFVGLACAHQREITIGRAIDDLTLVSRVFDPEAMRNRLEFLPALTALAKRQGVAGKPKAGAELGRSRFPVCAGLVGPSRHR